MRGDVSVGERLHLILLASFRSRCRPHLEQLERKPFGPETHYSTNTNSIIVKMALVICDRLEIMDSFTPEGQGSMAILLAT